MEKKWFRTALEARARLGRNLSHTEAGYDDFGKPLERQTLPSRGRMARIGVLAAAFGISAATLRNYLIALDAYEAIDDPDILSILRSYSAVAVAAFGRWYGRDPSEAVHYVRSNPDARLPEFLAAERASRNPVVLMRKRRPPFNDKLLKDVRLGPRMRAKLPAPIPEIAQSRIINQLPPQYRFAGLDHLLVPAIDSPSRDLSPFTLAGAISVPRFDLLETYGQRARGFWQRAISCALVSPLVLVVFPGPAARRRFLGAMPDPVWAHSDPRGAASASWADGPTARLDQGAHPIVFVPGVGMGLIVITSLLTLERDLAS